jgi:hypothetical protein
VADLLLDWSYHPGLKLGHAAVSAKRIPGERTTAVLVGDLANQVYELQSMQQRPGRAPGTQHSDTHSMICAICWAGPTGKPAIASLFTLAFALAVRSRATSLSAVVPHLPEMMGLLVGGIPWTMREMSQHKMVVLRA